MKKRIITVMLSSVMVFATFCHSTTLEAAELNPEHGFEQVNVEEFLTMNYESQGYVEVTDPAILMQQDDAAFEKQIGMSDDELLEYYNEYVASRTCLMSEDDKYSVEMLSGFADQAVKDGLVTDTPKQRAAVTKAVVRAEFKAVVAGGNVKGYTTAATLLNHSLQDYPQNMLCPSGSGIAAQIGRSSECTSIVNSFKKQVRGKNITSKTVTGTATLKSTTDLHLAFNKVSYQVVGKKYKGKWNLTITFTDRYDFETQAWRNSMTDHVAVTAINNYAAYAQSIGAIVPYDIKVFVVTSF